MIESHAHLYPIENRSHRPQPRRLSIERKEHRIKLFDDVRHELNCLDGPWAGRTILLTGNATMWMRLGAVTFRYAVDKLSRNRGMRCEYMFGRRMA